MPVETAADRAALVADFGETMLWAKTDQTTAEVVLLFQADHSINQEMGSDLLITDYIIEGPEEYLSGVVPSELIVYDGVIYKIIAVKNDGMGWISLLTERYVRSPGQSNYFDWFFNSVS